MKTHDEITVPEDVGLWEHQYHLPTMTGTPRQCAWARLIRHRFLIPVFGGIIEATEGLELGKAKAVYGCLNDIRATNDAQHWIEVLRHEVPRAIETLLKMPAMRAARLAEAEAERTVQEANDQLAAECRKIAAEARRWEKQHDMPAINGASKAQVNFARRCRYQLCKEVPEKAHELSTDAAYWIAAYLAAETEAKVTTEQSEA